MIVFAGIRKRVKLLLESRVNPTEMAPLIGLQPSVVRAYLKLLHEHRPDLIQEQQTNVSALT